MPSAAHGRRRGLPRAEHAGGHPRFTQQTLAADAFRTTASTEWTGIAEDGSSGRRALAGGFAEWSILKLSVFDGGSGTTMPRVETHGRGWSGGMLGGHKATKAFEQPSSGSAGRCRAPACRRIPGRATAPTV